MILFLKLCLLFLSGSVLGWIIEFFFRHHLTKRWANPGFLNGPWLPLYGAGTIILYGFSAWPMPLWLRLAGIAVSMTLLELVVGLLFLRFFKVRLWDYSDEKFNFKGIICPLYSFFWLILGVIFYFFLYPLFDGQLDFLAENIHLSFFMGILYGTLVVDVFVSFGIMAQIREARKGAEAAVERLQVNYEKLKLDLRIWVRENTKSTLGGRFLNPFRGGDKKGLRSMLLKQVSENRRTRIPREKSGSRKKKKPQAGD